MMNQKPFFTIVIPALNEAKFIPHLLKDLTKQTYKDFEVRIVDGSSEDKTALVADSFKTTLPLQVQITTTRNVSFQRNLGAKHSNAEWIIFLDADDQLPVYFLEGLHYHIIRTKPDCFTTFIKADSSNPQDKAIANASNYGIIASTWVKKPFAFGAIIGVRHSVFKAIKGFDEDLTYQEDVDFVRRVIEHDHSFKVFKDPHIIFSFRRFRKEGTLKLLRKGATIELSNLTNLIDVSVEDEYPMLGGNFYSKNEITPQKPQTYAFKAIYNNLNRLTKAQKIKIKRLINTLSDSM
jgi:glycosyltransferase involved in cell wall biosynthesis